VKQSVIRLYGIYHADGGIIGELSYVIGKFRGTAHCSLCDITHNKISAKKEWKELVNNLGAPIELLHLNERSNELMEVSDNKTPCIVSKVNNKLEIIITSEELDICKKSVDKFKEILNDKLLKI
tara:strand:+ start:2723 stop:3094 length:372 start_codon:yes stop_codon:yes gene_type:complete